MESENRKEHGGWLIQKGSKFCIIAALTESGNSSFFEYFKVLKAGFISGALASAEKTNFSKLDHFFRRFSETGPWGNETQLKYLEGDIFEFKVKETGLRVTFFYDPQIRGVIVLTHHFIKKSQRTRKEEIERANLIKNSFIKGRKIDE